MMARTSSRSIEKRNFALYVYLTEAERDRLKKIAEEFGMSDSGTARYLINDAIDKVIARHLRNAEER